MSFSDVIDFENLISNFFGSKYAVSTDSCTHAIELCLRINNDNNIIIPKYTYVGIPMIAEKLNLKWTWSDEKWSDFYYIGNTNIIDGAVLWKKNSYIKHSLLCISFQFQKHINIGRGGIILTDDQQKYDKLIKMAYDGRVRNIPWREQNISDLGYHYYLTPEDALRGIKIFNEKKDIVPKEWSYFDYPDLSKMKVFNK